MEIDLIGGAVTENQCIGAFTIGWALIGGVLTPSATYGWGTSAGWGLGGMLGGAGGLIVCGYIMTE